MLRPGSYVDFPRFATAVDNALYAAAIKRRSTIEAEVEAERRGQS